MGEKEGKGKGIKGRKEGKKRKQEKRKRKTKGEGTEKENEKRRRSWGRGEAAPDSRLGGHGPASVALERHNEGLRGGDKKGRKNIPHDTEARRSTLVSRRLLESLLQDQKERKNR